MNAVWMRARAEMRRRWRTGVVLALLVGLSGTVVLTSWAGARRTDSAYPNYLAATHAADYLISTDNSGSASSLAFYRQVEKLAEVARSGITAGPSLVSETNGRPDVDTATVVQSVASEDGQAGYTVGSVKVTAGRLPRPDRVFEALANTTLARQRHLHVGGRLTMYQTPPGSAQFGSNPAPSQLRPVTFLITGVGVSSDEVVPIAPNDGLPSLFATPAFHDAYDGGSNINFDGVFVSLRPGASRAAFKSAVDRMAQRYEASGTNGIGGIFVADLTVHEARVERALHPEALALELFAGLVALVGLLTVGQIIARDVALSSNEDPTLRALGFGRAHLIGVSVLRLAVPVFAGAALAVAGAAAASPLMPIGAARRAEPHLGFSVDPTVLGSGAAAIVLAFIAVGWWAAWRATGSIASFSGSETSQRRPSPAIAALARAGLRPPAVTGLRMALEPGRGRRAVPVRSATAGLVLAVASVVAVITFSANLGRLLSTPTLYGDTWSFALDSQFNAVPGADILKGVTNVGGIESVAGGTYGDDVTIDGRTVPAVGIDPLKGSVFPTMVSGRPPKGPGEIALGAQTMRSLHKRIGDTVTLVSQDRHFSLRIVGKVVLPAFGRGSFTPTDLGQGAVTEASVVAQPPASRGRYNFLLLRYSKSADASTVTARLVRLAHDMGCPGDSCLLPTSRMLPTDVRSYDRIRSLPAVLAALLAFFGVAMIGHALVTSVRRRRRDLAVLKTLGFVKREVAAAVAWQVSAFAVIGAVIGVPLGVAVGRWLWTLFADQLGVSPSPVLPLLSLIAVPAVIVVANAIGALPARSAARTRPATVLRSE